MELKVRRFTGGRVGDDTSMGLFSIDGSHKCFTIEDEKRLEKVPKETRVPEGTYEVSLRTSGGFHQRYSEKYGDMHKGMLCIHNRPNWVIENAGMSFQYILIHTGNTDEHTAGCLLLNFGLNTKTESGSSSVDAYKAIYPIIRDAILRGEKVTITYEDIE